MISVDFHTHTYASKDSMATPKQIRRVARRRGLGRVVITDHNTIRGGLAARALDPDLFIIGEEIMTTRGEILAVFVQEEVPRGLTPRETIQRLRDQGAFISVSHPLDSWRNGAWKVPDLLEIAPLVDAIEVFNARCMVRADNAKAQQFAREHNLAGTAGSDGHAAFEVGMARLALPPFASAEELRAVIAEGRVEGRLSPWWVHFASSFARLRKEAAQTRQKRDG